MLYPKYEPTIVICDAPNCYQNITGVNFDALLSSMRDSTSWLNIKVGGTWEHYCCAEHRDGTQERKKTNPRIVSAGNAGKAGYLKQIEERDKEKAAQ